MSSVPNWKDATAYEFLKAKNPPWPWLAFEFLRRNPEYQAAYAAWRKTSEELKKRPSPWQLKLNEPMGWFFDPPLNEGESVSDWERRVAAEGGFPKQEHYLTYLRDRFGISPSPMDPSEPAPLPPRFTPVADPPFFPDLDEVGEFYGSSDDEAHYPSHLPKKPLVTVTFDVSRPLDPQLRAAKEYLKTAKADAAEEGNYPPTYNEKRKEYRVPDLILLLRVLDGEAQGASPGEMASALLPDRPNSVGHGYQATKTVYDLLKRAKRLRDRGYRPLGLYRTPSDEI